MHILSTTQISQMNQRRLASSPIVFLAFKLSIVKYCSAGIGYAYNNDIIRTLSAYGYIFSDIPHIIFICNKYICDVINTSKELRTMTCMEAHQEPCMYLYTCYHYPISINVVSRIPDNTHTIKLCYIAIIQTISPVKYLQTTQSWIIIFYKKYQEHRVYILSILLI